MRKTKYLAILLAIISSLSIVAQPSNDNCSGAIAIMVDSTACTSGNTSLSNIGAIVSGQSSSCPRYPSRDIWYSFTVPTGYNAVFVKLFSLTSGTMLRTEIFNGGCTNLTSISCQNYFGNQFKRIENLQEDSTYFIRFYENDDEDFNSSFCLFTPPINELCEGAYQVTVDEGLCISPNIITNFPIANRSTQGSTCGFYSSSDRDLWYEFTMPNNRSVLHLNNSVVGAGCSINLYSGACGNLSSESCLPYINSPNISTIYDFEPDSTYTLRMDRTFLLFPDNEFCLYTTPSPENDVCLDAIIIYPGLDSCSMDVIDSHNIWANDSGISSCNSNYSGGDIWYKFVMPQQRFGAQIELTETIPNGNLFFEVYSNQCGNLTQEYCSSEILLGTNEIIPNLLPDSTYFLRFFESGNDAQDTFKFCLYTTPPPPVNDLCSSAIPINIGIDSCTTPSVNATNIGATDSGEIPICGVGIYNGGDVWYEGTVPAGKVSLKVDLINTSGNLYLEVYENSCGNLNPVYCSSTLNTNYDESIEQLTSGSTYLLRFFEDGFDVSGDFEFCVYAPTPPPNDTCGGAIPITLGIDDCGPTVNGENLNATDSNIPICQSSAYNGGDLWYNFTMPDDIGQVEFDILSSNTNGYPQWRVDIFKDDCDSLSQIYCNKYVNNTLLSGLNGDSTYLLRLFESQNNNLGTVDFCMYTHAVPLNNDCSTAELVLVDNCISSPSLGTNISASDSGEIGICGSGSYVGGDVWYQFNLPSAESSVFLDKVTGFGNIYVELYSGACGNLSAVICSQEMDNDILQYNNLTGGSSYYLRFFESGNNSFGEFNFNLISGSAITSNNNPSSAELITLGIDSCGGTTTIGNNFLAPDSGIPSLHGYHYSGGDIWYKFILPATTTEINFEFERRFGDLRYEVFSEVGDTISPIKFGSVSNNFSVNDLIPDQVHYFRIFDKWNNDFGCFEFCAYSTPSQVYIVNTSDDNDDGLCDSSHCSLREAVLAANYGNTTAFIHFDIPGSGPHEITPQYDFPQVGDYYTLIIDGTSQPNYNDGDIIINGQNRDYFNTVKYPYPTTTYNLQLYGLQFKNFYSGIGYYGNYKFGSVNKPNYFNDNGYEGIISEGICTLIGNYFGEYPDGSYSNMSGNVFGFDNYNYYNTTVGVFHNNFSNHTIYTDDIYGGGSSTTGNISSNYFYNNASVSSGAIIQNNVFGKTYNGTITSNNGTAIINNGYGGLVKNNEIFNYAVGIEFVSDLMYGIGSINLSHNLMFCVGEPHKNTAYDFPTNPPVISSYMNNVISGSIIPHNDMVWDTLTIEVYKTDDSSCSGNFCNPSIYLGSTIVNPNGTWQLILNQSLSVGDKILAFAKSSEYGSLTTEFSDCLEVTELTCSSAINTTQVEVSNTNNDGAGSLRHAIACVNSDSILDEIIFDIPGGIHQEIQITNPLGHIIDNGIILDATSLSGCSTKNCINLDKLTAFGDSISVFGLQANVIEIYGNNTRLGMPNKGNVILRNLYVRGYTNTIQSNFIGVDSTGLTKANPGLGSPYSNRAYAINIEGDIHGYSGYNTKTTFGGNRNLGEGNIICSADIAPYGGSSNLGDRGGLKIENRADSIDVLGNYFGIGIDSLTNFYSTGDAIHNLSNYSTIVIGSKEDGESNVIANNNRGIYASTNGYYEISNNSMYCNSIGIKTTSWGNPVIDTIFPNRIVGRGEPLDTIELFYASNDECANKTLNQGQQLIGITDVKSDSTWTYVSGTDFNLFDNITCTGTKPSSAPFQGAKWPGQTSQFSPFRRVYPSFCEFAQVLTINNEDCATTGAVVDMELLIDSGQGTGSSCDPTYAGNDAWFRIQSPDTYNSLVRVNINNGINAIAEAYVGTCDDLSFRQCIELDSLPHAMILDGYSPGTDIYIRVWDRDNTTVNNGLGALLHFTAHRLDTLQTDWEICDLENNLINGNPTILSEKDANKFIVQYEPDATPSEIQIEHDSLIALGATFYDSCLCGSNPIELWDNEDPIELEGNKRALSGRAKVDTTNYNYHFEPLEFRINVYGNGEQYNSNVTMDEEGNFVVIWEDSERENVYMRAFKSSGNPITQETDIRAGTQSSIQHNPIASIVDNGNFITAWHEIPLGNYDNTYSIYCRLWNSDGSDIGQAFNLSQESSNILSNDNPYKSISKYGTNVSITNDSNNEYVVAWESQSKIFFQKLNGTGTLIDTLHQVAPDYHNGYEPKPIASMNSLGNLVISWSSVDSVGKKDLFAQLYDSNLNEVGNIVSVNSFTLLDQKNVDVVIADNGTFIATWQSYNQVSGTSDFDIYAQRFDAAGNKIGTEFLVNTYTTDAQKNPSIALLDDGTFFITWDSYGQDGFEEGIFGQFFDSSGTPIGSEFQLNSFDDPEQENPSVATNGNSIVIATWEDGINDGYGKGIFGQRYEIIDAGGQKVFYPIGTATPSTLLGDELTYPGTIYTPSDSLSSVRVAIIDTGVDPNHPYLSGAIWNNQQVNDPNNCYVNDTLGYDFVNDVPNPIDYDGHGTKVNGIIARDFPGDIRLELMNLKFHEFQKGKVFDAVCAIYYAVDNGADIINMSWGFEASEFPAILKKAIQYASDNDVLMVTTAGNTSKDNDKLNKFPNNFDIANLIRVTSYEYKANTNTRKLANYASFGKNNVDIAAYGFVETPTLGDTLALASGTSLAAPHITRTAAIIKGLFPNLTAADIKDCILNSAAAEADFSDKVATGGILDHDAAIDCAYDKAANCVAIDLYITIPQTMDTVYRSDAWVETDATVTSNSDVEMYGAESVTMLPGFETTAGTEFLADIDDCDPLNAPMTTGPEEEEVVFRMRDNSIQAGKIKMQFLYQGAPIEISITDPQSGKIIEKYKFQPDSPGWYEKIIDAKLIKSGVYEIQFDNTTQLISKNIQVINKHYNKYLKRQKIKSEE